MLAWQWQYVFMLRKILRTFILKFSALLAAAVMCVPGAPLAAGESCPRACQTAREKIAVLAAEFKRGKSFYTSRAFSEAQARKRFIDPFFEAFGWDVDNSFTR